MRRQIRPFIVEVKQKRGPSKQSRSIWGDLDLSAIAAEAARETGPLKLPSRQLIDSDTLPFNAAAGNQSRAEHVMANVNEIEPAEITTEVPEKAEAKEPKKKASPVRRSAKAQPRRTAAKAGGKAAVSEPVAADQSRRSRKIYSEQERAQMLAQVERSIAGGESIKSASKQAGISVQTYYQWKKAAGSAPESDDLKGLLALEEENARLKKLLAERLRKENAELKKRLGLD